MIDFAFQRAVVVTKKNCLKKLIRLTGGESRESLPSVEQHDEGDHKDSRHPGHKIEPGSPAFSDRQPNSEPQLAEIVSTITIRVRTASAMNRHTTGVSGFSRETVKIGLPFAKRCSRNTPMFIRARTLLLVRAFERFVELDASETFSRSGFRTTTFHPDRSQGKQTLRTFHFF